MATMKAIQRSMGGYGNDMFLQKEYKKPVVTADTFIIKVKAAALNPVDYKAGGLILGPVMGRDVSGVVVEVGRNVTEFKVGDEVYGIVSGSLAEYASCRKNDVALKPKNLTFAEAAAMPLVYGTSLQGLRDHGKLKKGGRIMVIGASGGTGIAALQIGKSLGAGHITAICSGRNADMVKKHGADEVIDYNDCSPLEYYQKQCDGGGIPEETKFDIIYDAATGSGHGEDYKGMSNHLLKEGLNGMEHGKYVCLNGGLCNTWLRNYTVGLKAHHHLVLLDNNKSDLDILRKMTEDGATKPIIDTKLEFSEANVKSGYEKLAGRRVVGKVVIELEA